MSAARSAQRFTRAERVAQITALRAAGMTYPECAAALGITLSAVANIVNDPDGSKQRSRRMRYQGVCQECGGATDGSGGAAAAPTLCASCSNARQHEERRWTRETIIANLREFAETFGRTPSASDTWGLTPSWVGKWSEARLRELEAIKERGFRLVHPDAVAREFGSWAAGVRAAGLTPPSRGNPGHRKRRRKPAVRAVG